MLRVTIQSDEHSTGSRLKSESTYTLQDICTAYSWGGDTARFKYPFQGALGIRPGHECLESYIMNIRAEQSYVAVGIV